MARGRHYAKLSLSNAARLSFSDLCILLLLFLSLCRFLCVSAFLCSHWSLVDVPLIFFCPADHVPDWQPRVLLGMVEARSVNVKKTTTTTTGGCSEGLGAFRFFFKQQQAVVDVHDNLLDHSGDESAEQDLKMAPRI